MAGYVDCVSWHDSDTHIRVYHSDNNKVTEKAWDGHGWYTGLFSESGTTVGATSWVDGGGQIHIRVYVGSGSNGPITEYCWDKDKWYKGAFTGKGTGASATSWLAGSQIHIRVYVRDANNKVTERCWDGNGWYTGSYPS